MASLSEKISLLTNPAPKVLDPEDHDIDAAKFNKYNEDNDETLFEKSEFRSRSAVLLDDYKEYGGKKVSRKSLNKFFHEDETASPKKDPGNKSREEDKDLDDSNLHDDSEDDEDEDEEEISDMDSEEEISDKDLESFKTSVKKQPVTSDEENEESVEDEDSEESDVESNEDLTNKFSNIDVNNEKEKGAAIKAQQELWHRLCEARIKLQKLLIISNKLPQSDSWSALKKNFDKDMLQCLTKGSNSVKLLLNNCLDLQTEVLKKIPEISDNDCNMSQEIEKQSDEEIPSDSEEENQVEDNKEIKQETVKKMLKRKLKCDEYGEIVAKRHKSLLPYRNSVIQKWDEKTKLSSGKITQKSFSTFESSALKQIEQILQDESRLIKRTQLKRSLYRTLGKPDDSNIKSEESTEKKEPTSKQDMLLRDYDTEIFDDDDFYRQLLKDIIESKSVGIDPSVLRKQMEIQSVRNRIKKKVDTKASKGRKIRYDVHPKLVGFMKKMETTTLPDNTRDNLLKCMFGKGYVGL